MKALIICCSSKDIGIGHLSRSKILLNLLEKNLGWNVKILLLSDKNEQSILNQSNTNFLDINENIETYIERKKLSYDMIFFDFHPEIVPVKFTKLLTNLRNKGTKLVSIDCLTTYRKFLDLIIIPSFFVEQSKLFSDGCPILYGWRYLIINPEIKKKKWQYGNKVLILSGGSDVQNLGATLPKYLDDKLPKETIVDWVSGPYSSKPNFNDCNRIKINHHIAPKDIIELIENTNYAITLYGISFFELLFAGVPTVVFSGIKNKDTKQLEIIKKNNIALVAYDQYNAVEFLCSLLNDNKMCASLRFNTEKFINLVDNLKLIEAIKKIL